MKKPLFILLISSILFSGCGAIFGGHISDCQRYGPDPGQPKRQIRPAALLGDILCFFPFSLPVDFATGGIYQPCGTDSAGKVLPVKPDSITLAFDTALHKNHFTISTDLAQYILYQPNIGLEYRRKNIEYGLNAGYVFPSPLFTVNPLANGQYKWPGTVYTGETFRLYCKLYFNKKPRNYWAFQAVVKTLWYNNQSYMDMPSKEYDVRYKMNENETVLGLEVLNGREFSAFGNCGIFDLFWGFGVHDRLRTYQVISSDFLGGAPGSYLPLGTYKGYYYYITPVLGAKLGLGFLHKKHSPPQHN